MDSAGADGGSTAHRRKKLPVVNSAVNTLERHQSSRCPWSSAANRSASPALAYRNPTKLGVGPEGLGREDAGMP